MHPGDVIEELRNLDPTRQHRDIGDERNIAHKLIARVPRIASEHRQLSFIRSKAENRIERGRFARAVGPDDSEDAAFFDTQVYPIQRNHCAEHLAEPVCFYRCHSIGEISRKGAKPLRFGTEIRSFDVSVFFAPSRLSEKDSPWDCVAEVPCKGTTALRFFASQAGRRSTSFAL